MRAWFTNHKEMNESIFRELLVHIPQSHREEILRQHFLQDKSHKLIGRLMVEQLHFMFGYSFKWEDWKRDTRNKPYMNGGLRFNISHSGDYVAVVATNKGDVGIDIEEATDKNHMNLIDNFHIEEQEFIRCSEEKARAFMFVWTRKEAYLKAKGTGIIDGLNKESCLSNVIQSSEKWYLKSLDDIKGYHLAVCSNRSINNMTIQELRLNEIRERYKTIL